MLPHSHSDILVTLRFTLRIALATSMFSAAKYMRWDSYMWDEFWWFWYQRPHLNPCVFRGCLASITAFEKDDEYMFPILAQVYLATAMVYWLWSWTVTQASPVLIPERANAVFVNKTIGIDLQGSYRVNKVNRLYLPDMGTLKSWNVSSSEDKAPSENQDNAKFRGNKVKRRISNTKVISFSNILQTLWLWTWFADQLQSLQ